MNELFLLKGWGDETAITYASSDYFIVSAPTFEDALARCKEYNPTLNWESASLDEAYRGFALVTTP